MTVSCQTNKIIYIGNGVAKEFAIPFSFLEQQHIKVEQKQGSVQTERTDWTVKNGNLVFAIAPESGAEIAIVREVPLTQETDYRDNEILHAETLERNFDKLTMQIQQLKEQAERAVTVDIFDDTDAASLIPSIRQAVSDCAAYAATAQNKAQEALTQAQTAANQAQSAATSATNAGNSETHTATMLETKTNVDLNNLTAAGKGIVTTFGMPSTTKISGIFSATVTATEQSFTAPATGYIKIVNVSNAAVFCNTPYYNAHCGQLNGYSVQVLSPVLAGDQIKLKAPNGSVTISSSEFIYARGEV